MPQLVPQKKSNVIKKKSNLQPCGICDATNSDIFIISLLLTSRIIITSCDINYVILHDSNYSSYNNRHFFLVSEK